MTRRSFWDIFGTPKQLNSERWMIKNCTGMRKHWNEERIWSIKPDLKPPEMKRMKNDELEAPLESSWESPNKNIDGKEWRDFITNKMDTWFRNLSPWRKRGGWVGKTKATWRRMKQTSLRRTDNWSCGCWNDRIHLKRNTPVEKDWHDNLDKQEGLVFNSFPSDVLLF